LFINFYQAFSKQKPNVFVQYVSGTEVYTAPANQFTISKQVEQDWFSQMRALAKTKTGLVRLNTETKTYQVNTDSELWPDKLPKSPEEMIDFLKDLGITFTMADYLKLRKAKKAGELTETAFKGIEREALKAGVTAERAIQICCERGWVGFNAEWVQAKPQKQSFQDSREAAARTAFGSLLNNQFQVEKVIDHE